MDKNIFSFGDFQNKRKGTNVVNETVIVFDDHYKVRVNIDVPFSLVTSYIRKIKDETGEDIKRMYSDMEIAEEIAKYVSSSYLNIENVPSDILTPQKQDLVVGGQGQGLQSQGQGLQSQGQGLQSQGQQLQSQGQGLQSQGQQLQSQGQGQQSQGQGQQGLDLDLDLQGQQGQGGQSQVQKTAQKIAPQEI